MTSNPPNSRPEFPPVRIKLAGVPIGIRPLGPYLAQFCRDYVTEEEPVFWVTMTETMREEEEKRVAAVYGEKAAKRRGTARLAVYRMIADYMPQHDTFLMHASAIAYGDEGYLFTGSSGTGKSTHASLWKECFGEKVAFINDDKPLIRVTDTEVFACGTPWCGKEQRSTNRSVPVRGIVFIRQAKENRLIRIEEPEKAWDLLIHQTYRSRDPQVMRKILTLLGKVIARIPVYELQCTPDEEAVRTAFEGLIQNANGKGMPTMRLKDDYVLYDASEEERIAVATGDSADRFNGLLRLNKTAGAILEYLQEDITEEALVERMLERYDASEAEIRDGVAQVLDTLREVDALEE